MCTREHVNKVKDAILKLNKKAKIIETKKSVVDLNEVVNTNKFDFEVMEMYQKGLTTEAQEEEERGPEDVITSFVYQRKKPFNPHRLWNLLKSSFMIELVLAAHTHDDEEAEEEQGEEDEEE